MNRVTPYDSVSPTALTAIVPPSASPYTSVCRKALRSMEAGFVGVPGSESRR